MATENTKCLIIGSGPAGYTAAIYASRANISPILYEGIQPGGQLTTTSEVENFPGYPEGVMGSQLMEDLRQQALRFGADIRAGIIKEVDFSERPFKVTADDDTTIVADTVIVATGASAKYLGLPDEQRFAGLGVSACATCDGFFYRGKTVAVVGGGDTACEEAIYLSGLAKQVYLIVRKDFLRASKVMQKRVMDKENITVLFNTHLQAATRSVSLTSRLTDFSLQSDTSQTQKYSKANLNLTSRAISYFPVMTRLPVCPEYLQPAT